VSALPLELFYNSFASSRASVTQVKENEERKKNQCDHNTINPFERTEKKPSV
jgi:hypothetical protein